ncbi:hypothetical protein [Nevskia sp.]|uniref:hypothetical protein n=1 Tax=Nevskia sp. TaxID=1929292 RepID=UPI003F6F61B4
MTRAPKQRQGKWKRTPSKHTNIRLALDLRRRLETAAERSNRTVSSMGAECIRRALDDLEGVQPPAAVHVGANSAAA